MRKHCNVTVQVTFGIFYINDHFLEKTEHNIFILVTSKT
jgi:hypothetical protein